MKVLEINLNGVITCQPMVTDKSALIKAVMLRDLDKVEGEYELVFCMQMLQFVERGKVNDVARKLSQIVANGGEVWLSTPCLEWAMHKILKNEGDASTQFILYGNDDDPAYHSGFTLLWLRGLIEGVGLITRKATQNVMTMKQDGKDVNIPQNILIAMRFDGISSGDAALAVQ